MNCTTCQSLLLDYLEGALHAAATRQVEAHAATCPVCRMELALAQQIDRALSGQPLRMPPADFTTRVLAALPAVRTVAEPFWSQMLLPLAYAASILALILGPSPYLLNLSRLYEAWAGRVAMLTRSLGLAWPERYAEPGHLAAFLRTAQEVVGDVLSAMVAYGAQLQGFYSANAPTVHLACAALALVWVVYNSWQEAQA